MKHLLLVSMLALTAPFITSAQTDPVTVTPAENIVLPDPGFVPGDFFYFLDRWGEGFGNFFAFSNKSKAHRAIERAQERAAELSALLNEKGSRAPEIDEIQGVFENDLARAAQIIAEAQKGGEDVSTLAQEVSYGFEHSRAMMKKVYRDHKEKAESQLVSLKRALEQAIKSGNQTAVAEIQSKIDVMTGEQEFSLEEEGFLEDQFEDERANLDNTIGVARAAEVHMMNAMRDYQDALRGGVSTTTLGEYEDLMILANEALQSGDFETAKDYAKDAREIIHDAEHSQFFLGDEDDIFGDLKLEDDEDDKAEARAPAPSPVAPAPVEKKVQKEAPKPKPVAPPVDLTKEIDDELLEVDMGLFDADESIEGI